eukprot:3718416-Pyramimonas_sp.AAC.1
MTPSASQSEYEHKGFLHVRCHKRHTWERILEMALGTLMHVGLRDKPNAIPCTTVLSHMYERLDGKASHRG